MNQARMMMAVFTTCFALTYSATLGAEQQATPPMGKAPFDAATAEKHQEGWSKYIGVDVEITNSIGMKLVLIPAGEFTMGERLSMFEQQHRVRITKPFYLGIYEVTQEQYEKVMGENPSEVTGPALPVEQVSWKDATAFCAKLSAMDPRFDYRLPTEAEWEYACRAGTTTRYSCGDDLDPQNAWFRDNSDRKLHPVGKKRPNAWGLHEMHGNVLELCQDYRGSDYYANSPLDDPTGPSTGSDRVIRGGCFKWPSRDCRSGVRFGLSADLRLNYLGFRVAIVPAGSTPLPDVTTAPPAPAMPAPDPEPKPAEMVVKPDTIPAKSRPPQSTVDVSRSDKETTLDLGGGVTLELVLIPAGSFMMGDDVTKPVHKVRITKPFYLGKYEVTQEQWEAVMGNNPSKFKGPKNPVEQVSWDDCQKFFNKLNAKSGGQGGKFVLPTEAQWEYACRAGSAGKFCFGDDEKQLGEYAWYGENSDGKTHAVGGKKPNTFGLHDMHGNVWEWCQDWYGAYGAEAVDDPSGPTTGSGRVIRGGCWISGGSGCRSAFRYFEPGVRIGSLGFRVSRTVYQHEPAEEAAPAEMPPEAPKPPEPTADPSPAPLTGNSDDKTTKSEPRPSSLTQPAEAHLLFQEVEVYRIPKFVVQGLPLTQELHYRLLSELRVGRRQENGTREVRQTVYDTKLIKSDDLSKAAFAESLNGLPGKQFTFKLDGNQEVFGFEGKDDKKALPIDKLGGRGFMVTSVMDQDGWKELAALTFFVPNEQFANGQPWKRRMTHDWGPLGSWYGETTYKRNALQQTVHRIDYAHDMKYMPPAKDRRDLPFQISKADFKPQTAAGVIFFDTKDRRVTSAQERFHVKGLISTTVLGLASHVQIEEQQQITIQIHDQNPWRQ